MVNARGANAAMDGDIFANGLRPTLDNITAWHEVGADTNCRHGKGRPSCETLAHPFDHHPRYRLIEHHFRHLLGSGRSITVHNQARIAGILKNIANLAPILREGPCRQAGNDNRTRTALAHDQAFVAQQPQRVARGMAGDVMGRAQFEFGRQQVACRIKSVPDRSSQRVGQVAIEGQRTAHGCVSCHALASASR